MHQPSYFSRIRDGASKRWDQLEGDPELAGPWHQLFRQVQSPRHVVSELLQNADDAGATEATVTIDNGEFIFSHNGQDFDERQFASLCQFGFSNKRTLHTIGFRGMGFKSTFSLGDEVRLFTPTLSVAFHKGRFTEPRWIESVGTTGSQTEVRAVIQNDGVQPALAENLKEWAGSPASLLFFKSVRRLQVNEQEILWESRGPGPIAGSEWMAVSTRPDQQYLAIRSLEEEFPANALEEIKDERMARDDDATFPPCRVEIVLGMEGRLFVVLPTGVVTQLPFACNAPFIQDPARMKIKDPALSPTNRWLLKRAGELAAEAMISWVDQSSLAIEERCKAYGLLPDVGRGVNSIEGACGTIVEEAFNKGVGGAKFLLTESNSLLSSGECLSVPRALLEVWSPDQVSEAFSGDRLSILSRHVSAPDLGKLSNLDHTERLSKSQVLGTLRNSNLQRPESWKRLLRLWDYLAVELADTRNDPRSVRIVPVQGEDELYAANEVVRLGERRTLRPVDWEFLTPFLLVLDQDWAAYLNRGRRDADTDVTDELKNQVESAHRILRGLGLAESADPNRVLDRVVESFTAKQSWKKIANCTRLAHIAAKLGVTVPVRFPVVTQSNDMRRLDFLPVTADIDGDLDRFVDDDWYQHYVLHDDYAKMSETCTNAEWRQWIRSPGSRLRTFVPIGQTEATITSRNRVREALGQRGWQGQPYYHYKPNNFKVRDWDFPKDLWDHWMLLAEDDDQFWSALMTRILEQPQSYWSEATSARIDQVATTGNTRAVTQDPLLPQWIMRFRDLPCIPDTMGRPYQPAELLRRAPETEPLLGVELFVKAELDTEANRKLLMLLGVRDKPMGPDRLLERLRALASSSAPLIPEVQKSCHSLDQLFDNCSTEEQRQIRTAFAASKLILAEHDGWASTEEVFLNPDDDDVPGATLIHPSLRELALWRKIGVADRPTVDLVMEWLQGLRSGQRLNPDEMRRVRTLLPNYPGLIWDECGHWLNLEGQWMPVGQLAYSLTMQSLVPWNHLFQMVKAKTADFRSLSSETCQSSPFWDLPRLGGVIEERFQERLFESANPQPKTWLTTLGAGLQWIVLDDASQMAKIRELAQRLSQTRLQLAGGLESVPYIDGTPAGTSRATEAHWGGDLLYVQKGSSAKVAGAVTHEIAKAFDRQEITDAVKLCYERDPGFINEYLDGSFNLAPAEEDNPVGPLDGSAVEDLQPGVDMPPVAIHHGVGTDTDDFVDSDTIDKDINGGMPAATVDGGSSTVVVRHHRPPQPSVIERFFQARGFSTNGNGRFRHGNGDWAEKTQGQVFPWELRSAAGEIVRYYWPKEHCVQKEPLHLDADIWNLCAGHPGLYSLVLTDTSGEPIELTGERLVQMRERQELILYPATYRLVYEEGNN